MLQFHKNTSQWSLPHELTAKATPKMTAVFTFFEPYIQLGPVLKYLPLFPFIFVPEYTLLKFPLPYF